MFGTIRKHSQALWIPIIIVIVISFVVYFTPGYDPFEDSGPSQSENEAELSFSRQQVLLERALNMSQQFGGFLPTQITAQAIASQFPDQDLNHDGETDVSGLDYQAHLRLLRLNKAKSMGILVSDNMVKARLEQMFSNPNDKKFSTQAYKGFLNKYRGSGFLAGGITGETQFQELIRAQITFQQLDQLMTRSVGFFSDQATADLKAEENKQYTAQAVFFTTSNRVSEVTNFTTIATNYYQKVSNQYFVEPKRKIAYVLFPVDPYLADAEKEIKLDELVKKRIENHLSSTNSIDHLTDANGTKLEPGSKLDAAALAEVRKDKQTELDEKTLPKAKTAATQFRKLIFEGAGTEKGQLTQNDWSIARLRTKAVEEKLAVNSVVVDEANKKEASLPQSLVEALYALPNSAAGMLSTSAVEVSGKGYYVFGLEQVIPGHPRKYFELSRDEQTEVKKGFIDEEVKRLANEKGTDWREAVTENMAEGVIFADAIKKSDQITANLPPMTIAERDVNATTLKGLATVSEIQSVIGNLERENRSAAKPNWLSSYNTSSTEGVGGFIVHVSKVEKGDVPSGADLQEYANNQRQLARNFNSSFTAARYGITPSWLKSDMKTLNQQLIVSALTRRLNNIGYEIEQANSEVTELEKVITKAKSDPGLLSGSVTLEDLEADLLKAKSKLQQLGELRKTLPEKLKNTQQPAATN
ncbi:MAG: SurA N-terminal domain-containing protein [Verrucomicrobiota bacterium]|nr:SurA N-terminal domain-containing protein [Verrucomicrobiota bacterium]